MDGQGTSQDTYRFNDGRFPFLSFLSEVASAQLWAVRQTDGHIVSTFTLRGEEWDEKGITMG